jgi:threonyl-tRNA synthetase
MSHGSATPESTPPNAGVAVLRLTFPDGQTVEVPSGTSPFQAAKQAGQAGTGKALAARLDGTPIDLHHPLTRGGHVTLIGPGDPDAVEILRHSTSHLLAQAVKELFPAAKIAQGPVIEDGFYYDFGLPQPLSIDDLPKIEQRMHEIIERNLQIRRVEAPKSEVDALFAAQDEPYKLYFLRTKSGDVASYYQQGEFNDFCRGPHVPNTSRLGVFKLLSVAGAYWLGTEQNEMLWRVYGTAFATRAELDAYLTRLEEARRRDHRRLGKELDLFSIQETAGGGLVFWHPNGTVVRHQLEAALREELLNRGYLFVTTPHMARDTLFRTSGHYDFYRENMFTIETDEHEEFAVKPMNCPGHVMIYGARLRSYRELPVRMAEFGTVYRFERSGTLHGLFRVRGFTQDDAHIFCTPEQLLGEVDGCIDLALRIFELFGFNEVHYELSIHDPKDASKYIGAPSDWETAEKVLADALQARGLKYKTYPGEAAFYGPKIDIKVVDAIGRPWQLSTIQFDFNLPQRFGIEFIDRDGGHKQPYMVHRAIFGSFERFFGILIEHYGGDFPAWLAPLQARVLPVSEKVAEYAAEVQSRLAQAGLRAELDRSADKIGAKIRDAELAKIPYMLVVGAREAENQSVSLRVRHAGDQGVVPVHEFITRVQQKIAQRSLDAW